MSKAMLRVNEERKSAWLRWGSTVHHASVWRVGGMSSGARAGIWKGRMINADVFYINGARRCFLLFNPILLILKDLLCFKVHVVTTNLQDNTKKVRNKAAQ